jgi:hypothetical protein
VALFLLTLFAPAIGLLTHLTAFPNLRYQAALD